MSVLPPGLSLRVKGALLSNAFTDVFIHPIMSWLLILSCASPRVCVRVLYSGQLEKRGCTFPESRASVFFPFGLETVPSQIILPRPHSTNIAWSRPKRGGKTQEELLTSSQHSILNSASRSPLQSLSRSRMKGFHTGLRFAEIVSVLCT